MGKRKSNVVVVCGSRSWQDEKIIHRRLRKLPRGTILRSGGARGADGLAASTGRSLGLEVEEIKPDWGRYGISAGLKRNIQMLDKKPEPYLVIAFWDGLSKGTRHTIESAIDRGIDIEIITTNRRAMETLDLEFEVSEGNVQVVVG